MSSKFTKAEHESGGSLYDTSRNDVDTPALFGASKVDIALSRLKMLTGRLLNRLHIPGVIQPFRYYGPVTEAQIALDVGVLFTKLSVNGRDYYFSRFSGKWGGTGQCISPHADCTQD